MGSAVGKHFVYRLLAGTDRRIGDDQIKNTVDVFETIALHKLAGNVMLVCIALRQREGTVIDVGKGHMTVGIEHGQADTNRPPAAAKVQHGTLNVFGKGVQQYVGTGVQLSFGEHAGI